MRRSNKRGPLRLEGPMKKPTEVIVKKIIMDDDDPRISPPIKSLNVMFNYNGHSWDAFEILGVPAGSNFETCFLAFEKLTVNMDKESKEFLLSALEAIRQKNSQA
jgi:hypothetical protein